MPAIPRRVLLASTAASLPLCAIRKPARAAQFEYKSGGNLPATHPLTVRIQEAASRIAEATNGQVKIGIFPNSQLGSDTDMLGQLRNGALEFLTLSGLILSTFVPTASISGVGFVFRDNAQVWAAMDGALGAFIRGEIAAKGLVPFDRPFDSGFREITTSTRAIASPADLRGVKLRVPVSPILTSMFQALDGSPVPINFAEVYSALQTHIVDGQENPLAIISSAKLYEVQKYCSMTNHMWDGFWFLANRRAFAALPPEAQAIVKREMDRSALEQRGDVEKLNADVAAQLAAGGLTFNEVDQAPFRDQLKRAGYYDQWKSKFGSTGWTVLASATGGAV